eukprot:scaffold135389_cov27-Prasinocladus_malaysianus.AAC.1
MADSHSKTFSGRKPAFPTSRISLPALYCTRIRGIQYSRCAACYSYERHGNLRSDDRFHPSLPKVVLPWFWFYFYCSHGLPLVADCQVLRVEHWRGRSFVFPYRT